MTTRMGNSEALVECPYDPSHMITPLRMPYHLLKCRKNHPFTDFVVCPFNACHEVNKAELKYHMSNCPDKVLIEREITFDAIKKALVNSEFRIHKGCTDLPTYNNPTHNTGNDSDEDWDAERSDLTFSTVSLHQVRTRRQQPESILRRPATTGMAATLNCLVETEKNHSASIIHDFSLFSLGRGRMRTALSSESDDLDDGPPAMSPGSPAKPAPLPLPVVNRYPYCPAFGRGRGLVVKS
ncbi:uncharacterized protein LOC131940273 [Physella acuta]|uniref:uncharacterized protein LOC131940273 n=1 Tax=Physella acuta TaxID=109671 RepID=UPI0027DD4CCA|nr:uncharacterized protein LOC131940273 [Physella acuta]XP_059154898.1 uncharacterized protein LOC131940273 [Physella acuta]XP_059154899.1 uncharacterized protein LOC131940273 [Physella acuta]